MITRKAFLRPTLSPLRIYKRCFRQQNSLPKIPEPTPFVPDPATFLSLIGRNLSKHASKFDSWQSLFSMSSEQMQAAGIEPPRTRRYLLLWLDKFRRGEFGVGGDLQHVKDGEAELRVVQIPRLKPAATEKGEPYNPTSLTLSPGMIRVVVNLPMGQTEPKGPTKMLKKVKGMRLVGGSSIAGPHVVPRPGTNGAVGVIRVKEGLWEHKRGQKKDGGERRQAEVRWRRAVEEHRKNTP